MHGSLQVFCVDNSLYRKYRASSVVPGQSRVELSGIPELRKHCHMIPAQAQFEAVSVFMEHKVPSLLSSIMQWILQGSEIMTLERSNTLRRALQSSETHLLEVSLILSLIELF
jgi:hypothetical protein